MSLLGKLGFKYDEPVVETKTTEKVAADVNQPAAKKPTISFNAPTAMVGGQVIGKFDNEIFEKLSLAIEDNNLNGNDFLEFMQSLNKMSALAVDEKTKFGMVFATLSTSAGGMDKTHLIDSVEHYLNVIDKEKSTFQSEMGKAAAEMITKKESDADGLSAMIQQKSEQIQKLTIEIQELSGDITTLKSEAEQAKVAIAQKEANFAVTVQQLENQINDYKTKIVQHIQ